MGRLEGLPVSFVNHGIRICAGRLEGSAPIRGFLLDSHKHWIMIGGEAALVATEGDFLWGIGCFLLIHRRAVGGPIGIGEESVGINAGLWRNEDVVDA